MAHKARRRGSWKLSAKDTTRGRVAIPVVIAWKDNPPDVRELKQKPASGKVAGLEASTEGF